jgi:DNA adenine methylase
LFSFANVIPWNLTYGMRNITENSDQKGKELFISNYTLNQKQHKNEQLQLFD